MEQIVGLIEIPIIAALYPLFITNFNFIVDIDDGQVRLSSAFLCNFRAATFFL